MKTLKDSWFMLRSDFRGDKLKILGTLVITVVFMSYLGGLTSLIANDVLGEQDRTMLADFLFLSFIPLLGLTFSRRSMKYWSEDSYTKMLVYLRTLPIPAASNIIAEETSGCGLLYTKWYVILRYYLLVRREFPDRTGGSFVYSFCDYLARLRIHGLGSIYFY